MRALSKEERIKYDYTLKVCLGSTNAKGYAKNKAEKVLKGGMVKGLAKGVEKSKVDVAQNLKSMGLSVTGITKATELTEEEIEQGQNRGMK